MYLQRPHSRSVRKYWPLTMIWLIDGIGTLYLIPRTTTNTTTVQAWITHKTDIYIPIICNRISEFVYMVRSITCNIHTKQTNNRTWIAYMDMYGFCLMKYAA